MASISILYLYLLNSGVSGDYRNEPKDYLMTNHWANELDICTILILQHCLPN